MAKGSDQIKEVRRRVLYVLKLIYPAPRTAQSLLTTLIQIFPGLENEDFRKDIAYLSEKGYIERVLTDEERYPATTSLRNRWHKLTAAGVEIADRVIEDPALEV